MVTQLNIIYYSDKNDNLTTEIKVQDEEDCAYHMYMCQAKLIKHIRTASCMSVNILLSTEWNG